MLAWAVRVEPKHVRVLTINPLWQVRGLCVCELGLLTSSRDKTAKLWQEQSANAFTVIKTYVRRAWPRQNDVVMLCSFLHATMQGDATRGALLSLRLCDQIQKLQVGHTDYVGPVAYLPQGTSARMPKGAVITGLLDLLMASTAVV